MTATYIFSRINSLLRNNSFTKSFTYQHRHASYNTSKTINDIKEYNTKYEITKSPAEWKYVENLLAPLVIPDPKLKIEYNSGWKPQAENVTKEVYYIMRTKNFMIPVYLASTHRGMRKITKIRRIQGDIFALEKDLKNYLQKTLNRDVATQVNEFVGYIHIKGDHVNLIKDYLVNKGF